MAYEQYRRHIDYNFPGMGSGPVVKQDHYLEELLFFFTYPLDLVRTKLAYQVMDTPKLNMKEAMSSEHAYRGIRDCFSRAYRDAGIRGLYRGVGMNFVFQEHLMLLIPYTEGPNKKPYMAIIKI
ncbi:unnamed protein product [Lactuca virosa]|uniref:ADP/ATP translocase n=1 Tax=Lactuca virosa TaxID=75947 RepID=A0AAU9NTW3_9ASTR|nr:unnamed protein product [Lactuca virosa]